MSKRKIELTEAEWAIMKEVWKCAPCAAPSIQEALLSTRNWSHSTVRTMMDRMVAKGLLRTEKVRNLTLYRPEVSAEQAQQGEVLYTLKHAFNGALAPMMQCLLNTNDLKEEDLAELEKLIREKRKKSGP